MKVAVKTLENKSAGEIELDEAVFGASLREDILHRVVNWQRATRRAGTHKTKGISEVSGTGKKPFKQKGTGNARAGSTRNSQHRGGATIFGPVVRDHGFKLPKAIRRLALRVALSSKQANGKLVVLDAAKAQNHKTKDMAKALSGLGLTSALFVDAALDDNFALALRNIPHVDVLPQEGINVYDILRRDTLVLTKDAVAKLEERLK